MCNIYFMYLWPTLVGNIDYIRIIKFEHIFSFNNGFNSNDLLTFMNLMRFIEK